MDFEDKMHRQQFEEMYNQYQTPLRKLAYRDRKSTRLNSSH